MNTKIDILPDSGLIIDTLSLSLKTCINSSEIFGEDLTAMFIQFRWKIISSQILTEHLANKIQLVNASVRRTTIFLLESKVSDMAIPSFPGLYCYWSWAGWLWSRICLTLPSSVYTSYRAVGTRAR